jgi:hypothetical protein
MPLASDDTRKAGRKRKKPRASRVRDVSRATQRPKSLDDLYGGGVGGNLLNGRYQTDKVYAWFQKRHKKGRRLIDDDGFYRNDDHEWKVPLGVREALKHPLNTSQISNRYPWYVTWRSPKTGKQLKKYFNTLPQAIVFVAERAQYVDSHATIVSRHGYDIPRQFRGRIPKPWKWCPGCMKPRKYRRVYSRLTGQPQTFYAMRKEWNSTKSKYEYMDRELALLRCPACGCTNRDIKFRRSNQPWEIKKIKRKKRRPKRG